MAKISAPNKQYSGISAGVTFINGVGETANPLLIAWFKEKGYKVEEKPVKEEMPVEKKPVKDLEIEQPKKPGRKKKSE
jgi:hypothetical protein